MNFKPQQKSLLGLAISTILAAISTEAAAQSTIINDGSFSTYKGAIPANKGTTTYAIDGGKFINEQRLGAISGKNLFFSFAQFNVGQKDVAQFSCSKCVVAGGSFANIISRVTGGNQSNINGIINYHANANGNIDSNIRNANFWFFNPNGVVFGQGAVVDVPAQLHIGSASQLKDSAGNILFDTKSSSLTTETPSSFGFLGSDKNITINGGAQANPTTFKAAGTIEIVGSNLIINAGETTFVDANTKLGTQIGGLHPGNITIAKGAILSVKGAQPSLSVTAANNLINNGIINGDATAAGDLVNNSKVGTVDTVNVKITGDATAGTQLINRGTISGSALAGTDLRNKGRIGTAKTNGEPADVATATSGDLINGGTITGNATAGTQLINRATIGGKATSGTSASGVQALPVDARGHKFTLLNRARATLVGAESNNGSDISNAGTITGNVLAANHLSNTATINGTATANQLVNRGTISGSALAGTDLLNKGRIGTVKTNGEPADSAKATTGYLQNNGIINGDATAAGALVNNSKVGTVDTVNVKITGHATAGTQLVNRGTISGSALAGADLLNKGRIGTAKTNGEPADVATATRGDLINGGTITGNATAGTQLINRATIGGKATSGTSASGVQTLPVDARGHKFTLINRAGATLGGGAESNNGSDISNAGTITGNVLAANHLSNTATATINGTATANINLLNAGAITQSAAAGQNLTNAGSIGANANASHDLENSGQIGGNAVAANNLSNTTTAAINGTVTANNNLSNAGAIADSATAGHNLSNSGSIGANATAGHNLNNSGQINGTATAADNLVNNGTINGASTATNGNLQNNTGAAPNTAIKIDGNASAGAKLDNRGAIGGKAVSGTSKKGALTNVKGATISKGAESRNDADISNAGTITGDVFAANILNNTGVIQSSHVVAGTAININGGMILGGSDRALSTNENGLLIAAPTVNLTAGIIRGKAAIEIRPDDTNQENIEAEINPAQLNFLGDSPSSVWAHNNLGVQHRLNHNANVIGLPDYLKNKTVYYTINFNGNTGNIIGSETAKVSLTHENFKALSANPTIQATILTPTTEEFWQQKLLLTGNRLINAYETPQSGNVVAAIQSVVTQPVLIPIVSSSPCAQDQGSTLEIKNTNGVILQFNKMLPFSVFPDAKDQHGQKGKYLNSVTANPESLTLASLAKNSSACNKI